MRIRRLVTLALAAAALSSCESSDTPAIAVLSPVPTFGRAVVLVITPSFIRIPIGTSATLSANAAVFEWVSLNQAVVTITQDGVLTGLNVGTATIRAVSLSDPTVIATAIVEVTPALIP